MTNKVEDLMNISLEKISNSSEIYTSINLEDSFVEASIAFLPHFTIQLLIVSTMH
ncbi:hypothetical protein [Rickettsia endosymbiont of Pantilius tunicatus]|uniref:hypothetical protein n=1 Tax=Rickettsia endosymbiont of Pantilius tunicatus TaxID=3066267 RepID=UPI00376EDFA0